MRSPRLWSGVERAVLTFGLVLTCVRCTPVKAPHVSRDGGSSDAGSKQVDPACAAGLCWWSSTKDGCETASVPTPEFRPSANLDNPAPDLGELYFGWTAIHLGGPSTRADSQTSSPAQMLGFDIDGVCTNSASCPGVRDAVSCHSRADQLAYDGDNCRDNSLAEALEIIGQVPEIGGRFGLSEEVINCELWRGSYNVIVRVLGYNGLADDDHVRVDWYTSDGIDPQPSWRCPATDFQNTYPLWRKSTMWRVDEQGLNGALDEPTHLPASRVADDAAYVRDGYLVSQMPEPASLRLAGDAKPFRGLALTVHRGVWVGKLYRAPDKTWRITDGLVGGRVTTDDVLHSLHQTGFCSGMGVDAFHTSIATYIEESADVLASGDNAPDTPCDALSFGIGFEAAELTPASVPAALPPLIECCSPGVSAIDCRPKCGDGVVSGTELCDTQLGRDEPGACPTSCDALDSCTPQVVVGAGCDVHCDARPITTFVPGDGCCPAGANATEDSDCRAVCGNGVLEGGETCERAASSCGPCLSRDPCLVASASGSANDCTAECSYISINTCRTGDRCCPKGCSRSTDGDCSTKCGDGTVDEASGETCERVGDTPCPDRCDDGDACTIDFETGSAANCNVNCTHVPLVAAHDADGCCPPGANANVDADCASRCGNGTLEHPEECDDGARIAGDGCSPTCKRETEQQMCQQWVGVQQPGTTQVDGDACSECVCRSCPMETATCYGGDNVEDVRLCDVLVDCIRTTWCDGVACYCGQDLLSCSFGTPAGPCRQEVQAAARTTVTSEILARSSDLKSPFGRAFALGTCAYDKCARECDFN